MSNLKSMFAFIGGVAAGAAIALLFAPQSGEETRRQIQEYAREKGVPMNKEELDALVQKVSERLRDKFNKDELKAAVMAVVDELRGKLDEPANA